MNISQSNKIKDSCNLLSKDKKAGSLSVEESEALPDTLSLGLPSLATACASSAATDAWTGLLGERVKAMESKPLSHQGLPHQRHAHPLLVGLAQIPWLQRVAESASDLTPLHRHLQRRTRRRESWMG